MILLTQHDQAQSQRIRKCLEALGHQCVTTLNDPCEAIAANQFSLVVLDIVLPGRCGLDVCRQIRRQYPLLPVIIATASQSETDHILALELGADDVVMLSCHDRVLQARVKVQLRRYRPEYEEKPPECHLLQSGRLSLDIKSHQARIGERALPLTATEFMLLAHFVRHPNQVFSRNQLLETVWGHQLDCYEHTVVSHINRLRSKLAADKSVAAMLETVRGVGYRFTPRPPVSSLRQHRASADRYSAATY